MHFDHHTRGAAARCGEICQADREPREVEQLADRVEILAFDAEAAVHSADIRAVLERAGQSIGAYDLLIAGHARSRGLAVVTGNLSEFRRLSGLRAEDWLAARDC